LPLVQHRPQDPARGAEPHSRAGVRTDAGLKLRTRYGAVSQSGGLHARRICDTQI